MRSGFQLLAALAAATVVSSQAHANTIDIGLTGAVADFQESNFYFNGDTDRFQVSLQGIDPSNGPVVAQGDTINSTVSFDQAITIAASTGHTNLVQAFNSTEFTSGDTGVTGTFTFYNAGQQVASFDYGSTTSSQLSSYAALFPPRNTPLTFDSFKNSFTVDRLDQATALQFSTFTYDLVSAVPVPEPGEWAMIAAGLGVVGAAARRRKR